jgi:hypothetical protein
MMRRVEACAKPFCAYAHLICDVTQPAEVADVLRPHAERIAVLVHNAAALLIKPFEIRHLQYAKTPDRACLCGPWRAKNDDATARE